MERRQQPSGQSTAATCRFTAALALAAAALTLAACERHEAGVTHLQFSLWGSTLQQKIERDSVARFERLHPDIKVDTLLINSHYVEKVQAMMVGDVAPDVMLVELSQNFDWAARGVLMDLSGDMDRLAQNAPLMPVPQMAYDRDGRCYSLPVSVSGYVTYANTDALAKAGVDLSGPAVSWERIREVAPKLSRRHGDPNAATDYALMLPPPAIFFWQWGADLFDDPFHPARVTINSPPALAALNCLREMEASGFVVPPDMANDQGTYQLFRDGKVALYFNGRWITPDFAGHTAFAWDVFPMPHGPVSGITQHGGSGVSVSSKTRHPEAAREFARYYASPDNARAAMHGGRFVPVYRSLAYGDEFLGLRPPASPRRYAETMEAGAARSMCYVPGLAEVTLIFNSRIEQAISQPQVPSVTVLAGLEVDLRRWLETSRRHLPPP